MEDLLDERQYGNDAG